MTTRARPILLVEDDPRDLELALAALSRCSLSNRIDVARDGAEALDYLHARGDWHDREPGDPAVVLLDLKLPKIDGLEVLRQVRNDDALKLLPVVMLTASREPRDLMTSYRLGANAFVVKPIEFDDYLAAVRELGVFWGARNEPSPRSNAA